MSSGDDARRRFAAAVAARDRLEAELALSEQRRLADELEAEVAALTAAADAAEGQRLAADVEAWLAFREWRWE